jgi:hypothetical protein
MYFENDVKTEEMQILEYRWTVYKAFKEYKIPPPTLLHKVY